jgi:hypothetical protein
MVGGKIAANVLQRKRRQARLPSRPQCDGVPHVLPDCHPRIAYL